ncbi:MAG: hypothetical protein ACOX17_08335 [Christensenellales bacterium]|jgi:uncharacterized membrane protein required for colicin V production
MNLIDLAVLGFLTLMALVGWYQGLIRATSMSAAGLVCLLIAALFFGLTARSIASDGEILKQLLYYAEGSEMLGGIRVSGLRAGKVSSVLLERITAGEWTDPMMPLPAHLARVFTENVEHAIFAPFGAETLGHYLSYTVAHMTINLVSFTAVYALAFTVSVLIIRGCDSVFRFPKLRILDGPAGAVMGLATGYVLLNVLFLLLPVVQSYLPIAIIYDLVDDSVCCRLFLDSNFLLPFFRGYVAA